MGAARIAGIMDQLGSDNDVALRTTSGDNVGGSAFVSAISNDEYTIKALNEMGIDVSAVGNHEFDKGQDDLKNRIQKESHFPILGANVINIATGEPALEPSFVVDKGDLSIGFVGTVTTQTPNKVSPSGIVGLEFTDPVAAANKEATRLKKEENVDAVIVLQHEDIEAVNGFNSDVDAAFGGDSHLRHPGDTRAQSQEYGKVVSELEFDYDQAADAASNFHIKQYDFTTSGTVAPDPTVAATVAEAETQAKVLGDRVVATIDNSYFRGKQLGGESSSNRGVESTLNNMLADSNKQAMNKFLGSDVVDLGIMNAGGVRADLAAGEVTYAEAQTVQPFGNNLAYATLSGAAILKALENQWKVNPARPRLSMGLSDNASYSYDPSVKEGPRVLDARIDGKPIDPAADYRVAGASFLFQGGDGFIDPADVRNYTDVGYTDIAAFTDYLAMEDAPTYRKGQSDIGIAGLAGLAAGQKTTLELTSLSYSNSTEPQATSVTVHIGDLEFSAPVNNDMTAADNGLGEVGRASVDVTLPETYAGDEPIWVTTDAGTKVAVRGALPGDSTDPNGSALGSSVSDILAGLLGLGVAGGLLAAVLNFLFPAQVRQTIEDFRHLLP